MAPVLIITYASFAVFVIAVVARFMKFRNMPIHLRWELYPVPHEANKSRYGGSYLEEFEWWTKKRDRSLARDFAAMAPEILFLKGVWEHNRSQWLRSFPFHFGLYMILALIVLLAVGGVAQSAGLQIEADADGFKAALYHATYIVGWCGFALSLSGSVLLLGRRLFNRSYAEYTKRGDYLNLAFFIVALTAAVAAHAAVDPFFTALRDYFQNLTAFNLDWEAELSGLSVLEIVLASLLAAYIPLTKMSHFVGKFFMYHDVRWNDEPNRRGGRIEKRVEDALNQPVSWAAAHIRGDGKKNWKEVATSGVEPE